MNRYIFIGIVFIAITTSFFYFTSNRKGTTSENTYESPTPTQSFSPQKVTKVFYDAYISCMKQPPEMALGAVSVYCQTHTGYTSHDFIQNLEKGGTALAGADPILCSQSPPDSVSVERVSEGKTDATVHVLSTFGERVTPIKTTLTKHNSKWLVSNIECPTP